MDSNHSKLHKLELRKESVTADRNLQGTGGWDLQVPSSPLAGPPPPAGAQADAQGLHLSEAPALTSFPRTQRAQGRGREEQPEEKGTEIQREGGLEQKTLGPELGVAGIAPTSRTLSNLLPTGQNFQVYFYSRRKRAVRPELGLGGRAFA